MARRVIAYIDRQMSATINEDKLKSIVGEGGVKKQENKLADLVRSGDSSVTGLLTAIEAGGDGDYDPYRETEVDFVIEIECEKHPGYWMRQMPAEKCQACKAEKIKE